MSQNSPVNILYHGSARKIDRMLTMHRGRNLDKKSEGNQFGIYATPDLPTAMVYTMGVKRTALFRPKVLDISYSKECIHVLFRNCCWNRKTGYVYSVPADSFDRHNDFEYCSHQDVPIIERREIVPAQIDDLVASGKLVLTQDVPPSSLLLRKLYSVIDKVVHSVAVISHCFYVIRYK